MGSWRHKVTGNDAKECVIQGRVGANPLKNKVADKKKQKVAKVVTPRNKKTAKPAWIESTMKKVISKSAGVNRTSPKVL